jgi:hypothetical protein
VTRYKTSDNTLSFLADDIATFHATPSFGNVPVRETPGFARRPAEHHLSDLKFEAVQRHTIAQYS